MVTHSVNDCPEKKKPHKTTRYVGSATSGLGFLSVDVSDINDKLFGNLKNIGLVLVEPGEISKEDLAKRIHHDLQNQLAMADKEAQPLVFPGEISS